MNVSGLTKTCTKCKCDKNISEFHKHKESKSGYFTQCKICINKRNNEYYSKNKEKYKPGRDRYQTENRENILKVKREYVAQHKEEKIAYDKIYRQENKEKIAKGKKDWATKNKDKPYLKIKNNLRRRIHHVIKDGYKSDHTMNLLGCTIDFFLSHLENQFVDGMTWDNYGPYGWHVDHIIPCCTFDLTMDDEQRKCFHYSNMRPLWWIDNLSRKKTG